MTNYHDLREKYTKDELLEENALQDPYMMFQKWMVDAINDKVNEPNAMILSTIDENNAPHARTVLLKEIYEGEFVFYTNYESDKARQIDSNPHVSLLFLWHESQRQLRITGLAKRISEEKSTLYFKSRPRGSQIGAWTSPQSSVIKSRDELDKKRLEIVQANHGKDILDKPSFWGGYGVKPTSIEFWQGRDNRLHDRLKYNKVDDDRVWVIERLAP